MKLEADFLRGSYTPVITPFHDGQVDLDSYARLLRRQVDEGSHGVVICGTTGEPSSLTLEERNQLLGVAIETVGGKIPVVAATGSQSLQETRLLSQEAEKMGADALLIVTPYYIKPTAEGLVQYYRSLADDFSLPWMIYHIPGRAGVSMTPESVEEIASDVPHLVGIKHAVNDLEFVTELLSRLGPDFRIFCGLESLSFPMLALGGAGLMNAVGNLLPSAVARLCQAVEEGNLQAARKLHFELFGLNRAIFLSTNPIPLKFMMKRLGHLERDELRLPLHPVGEEKQRILDRVLIEAGLLSGSLQAAGE